MRYGFTLRHIPNDGNWAGRDWTAHTYVRRQEEVPRHSKISICVSRKSWEEHPNCGRMDPERKQALGARQEEHDEPGGEIVEK